MTDLQEFKERLRNLGFKQAKDGKITLKFEPQAKVVKLGQGDVKTSHLHWSEPRWWGRESHPYHPLRKPESRPYVCRERRK